MSIIDPNNILTPGWSKTIDATKDTFNKLTDNAKSIYGNLIFDAINKAEKTAKNAKSPDVIAKTVNKILLSKHPKLRYLPGFDNKISYFLFRILPRKLFNYILLKQMGIA